MELRVIQADGVLTHVALCGRLDLRGVSEIENRFVFTTTSRRVPVVVDLSEVEFIASLGIGMLVSAAKALTRQGLELVLLAPPGLARETLEIAGVTRVVPTAADMESARALIARA
jgi:anti-sigma B factor antagonist